jgi:hypothetical protein
LFALSCLCCHVLVVLSNQHCPGSPGLEIQSRLSYSDCPAFFLTVQDCLIIADWNWRINNKWKKTFLF